MNYLAQYQALRDKSPRIALVNMNHQNSAYCNWCAENKDSYMLFGSEHNDATLYGTWIYDSKDCVDCDFSHACELCYSCVDCESCYNCTNCQDCENSTDCELCYDCNGCRDCFGCVGLRHKQYCVFNEQLDSKETYEQRVKQWRAKGTVALEEAFQALQRATPRKFMHEKQIEESSGDYIHTSRNTYYSFDVRDLEDCMYMNSSIGSNDCIDCSNIYFGCEQNYEVMSAINIKNCSYCAMIYDCSDLMYCEQMWNCHDCMFSTTLKRKEYCILNEQYSKEEYFKQRTAILDEMKRSGELGKHIASTYPDPLVYPLS